MSVKHLHRYVTEFMHRCNMSRVDTVDSMGRIRLTACSGVG
jgi:hypothetical protein